MSGTVQNLVIAAVGLVLPTVLAIWLYKRQLRDPSPVFALTGNQVVALRGSSGDIEIRYKGVTVPRVNRTLIFFWNRGRGSIRAEDVRKRVTFSVIDGDVLQDQVLMATRAEIEADCMSSKSEIQIAFSHLDRGDGMCVEVLHTGKTSLDISVRGVIIGVPQGIKRLESPLADSSPTSYLICGIGLLFTLYGVIAGIFQDNWIWYFFATAGVMWFMLGISMYRGDKRRLPRAFRDLDITPVQQPRSFLRSLLGKPGS